MGALCLSLFWCALLYARSSFATLLEITCHGSYIPSYNGMHATSATTQCIELFNEDIHAISSRIDPLGFVKSQVVDVTTYAMWLYSEKL